MHFYTLKNSPSRTSGPRYMKIYSPGRLDFSWRTQQTLAFRWNEVHLEPGDLFWETDEASLLED